MLSFRVDEQTLKRTDSTTVVNNSVGYLKAEFDFSNDWAGYEKYAQFNNYEVHISAEDNICDVPSEALRNKTALNVNVYGKDYDDNKFLTTNMTTLNLVQSGYSEEIIPNYEELYYDAQAQVNYQNEIIDSLNARIIELEQQISNGDTGGGEPVVSNSVSVYAYVNGIETTSFTQNDSVELKVRVNKDLVEEYNITKVEAGFWGGSMQFEQWPSEDYVDEEQFREFTIHAMTVNTNIDILKLIVWGADDNAVIIDDIRFSTLGWTVSAEAPVVSSPVSINAYVNDIEAVQFNNGDEVVLKVNLSTMYENLAEVTSVDINVWQGDNCISTQQASEYIDNMTHRQYVYNAIPFNSEITSIAVMLVGDGMPIWDKAFTIDELGWQVLN